MIDALHLCLNRDIHQNILKSACIHDSPGWICSQYRVETNTSMSSRTEFSSACHSALVLSLICPMPLPIAQCNYRTHTYKDYTLSMLRRGRGHWKTHWDSGAKWPQLFMSTLCWGLKYIGYKKEQNTCSQIRTVYILWPRGGCYPHLKKLMFSSHQSRDKSNRQKKSHRSQQFIISVYSTKFARC